MQPEDFQLRVMQARGRPSGARPDGAQAAAPQPPFSADRLNATTAPHEGDAGDGSDPDFDLTHVAVLGYN